MKKINLFVILGLAFSGTNACTATQEQFDFSKKAPDEFAVITRAPLEIPETLELPTPRPGMKRPQESTPEDQAKETLFGQPGSQTTNTKISSGEAILLEKTGANAVNPNIRDLVDEETEEAVKENTSTFNKILGRAGKKIDTPAQVIDPVKERERIMQTQTSSTPE